MSVPTIAVIGSLNIDLVTYTSRIPIGGETMTANSFRVALGGKGGNQAVACAKLSRSHSALQAGRVVVKMMGAVGSDAYGDTMTTGLESFGVDVSGVQRRIDATTGVAVILVEENTGENRILLSPEANHSLLPEHFREAWPAPLPALIILQLEIPLKTVLQIADSARRQNIPVLLNPAPAQKIPVEYYRAVSHLVMNESEAAYLTNCAASDLETAEGLSKIAASFQSLGAENVLITLGGRGVYYLSSSGQEGLVPAEKVCIVDTTAAGDTFIGAYALQVVQADFDIQSAVRIANRAAAMTVERKGAQESIPWLDEMEVWS